MTKSEHDAATKENWGSASMASDERAHYRERRYCYGEAPRDRLEERANWRRCNPEVPTLGRSSHWRAPVRWHFRHLEKS